MSGLTLKQVARRYQVQTHVVFDWVEARFLPQPRKYRDGEPMWDERDLDAHDGAVWAGRGRPDGDKHFVPRHQEEQPQPPKLRPATPGRAQLRRLQSAIEHNRPVPEDVAQWLSEALERFEQGEPLDKAMHVKRSRDLIKARDDHLDAAAGKMPTDWPGTERARQALRAAQSDQVVDDWAVEIKQAIECAPLPSERQLRRRLAIP